MAQQHPRLNDQPPQSTQDVEDDVTAAQVAVTAAFVAALAAALAALLRRAPRAVGQALSRAAGGALRAVSVNLSQPLESVVRQVLLSSSDGALVVRRGRLADVAPELERRVMTLDERVRVSLDAASALPDPDALSAAVAGVADQARTETSDAVTAAHGIGARARAEEAAADTAAGADGESVRVRLVWRAREGSCPTCSALDGTSSEPGGDFVEGLAHPPAHPSCRCWLEVVRTRKKVKA